MDGHFDNMSGLKTSQTFQNYTQFHININNMYKTLLGTV